MLIKNGVKKSADPMFAATAKGLLIAVLVTIAGISICGVLLTSELTSEEAIGKCAIAVQLISAALGTMTLKRKENRMVAALTICLCYAGLLLATTVLFLGGQYSGIWTSLLVILLGSILGTITANRLNSGGKARRSKIRRR